MNNQVYLKFVQEKQWLSLCSREWEEVIDGFTEEAQVEWAFGTQDNQPITTELGTFAEFITAAKARYEHSYQYGITLVISGMNMVATQVNIPSKQTRHIAQAIPFMIEDQVVQDVADLHFVIGSRDDEGNIPVLAIPHEVMTATCDIFEHFDLPLDSVVADMLCLPMADNEWTLAVDGSHLLLRRAPWSGMAIEMDAAPVVLSAILDHWEDKPELVRVLVCEAQLSPNLKNWLKSQISSSFANLELPLEYDEIDATKFGIVCQELNREAGKKRPHDFMQGTYGMKSRRRKPSGFNWKPLAALVAMFLVLHTAFLYVQAAKYNAEAERIAGETKALYKQLFPRDQRVVNIKRQMQTHLDNYLRGGGGDDFMVLLATTGKEIRSLNATSKDAIQPRRVSYDEGQGDLRLDLIVKDYAQLEAFKNRLEKNALAVETAQASQDKGEVKARLNIRSAKS